MRRVARPQVLGLALAGMLMACSPVFDWREVHPEGSGAAALFPCRPASHARATALGAERVDMTMFACVAGDATFALSFADVGSVQRVAPALSDLRLAAIANVNGTVSEFGPAAIPGMTPGAEAQRLSIQGRLPGGSAAVEWVVFFSRGTRVYQATVVGPRLDREAVDSFVGALRLGS